MSRKRQTTTGGKLEIVEKSSQAVQHTCKSILQRYLCFPVSGKGLKIFSVLLQLHSSGLFSRGVIKTLRFTTMLPEGPVQNDHTGETPVYYYLMFQGNVWYTHSSKLATNRPQTTCNLLSLSMNLHKPLCFLRKYSEL